MFAQIGQAYAIASMECQDMKDSHMVNSAKHNMDHDNHDLAMSTQSHDCCSDMAACFCPTTGCSYSAIAIDNFAAFAKFNQEKQQYSFTKYPQLHLTSLYRPPIYR